MSASPWPPPAAEGGWLPEWLPENFRLGPVALRGDSWSLAKRPRPGLHFGRSSRGGYAQIHR